VTEQLSQDSRALSAGRELDALVAEKVFGRDVAWWAKPTREPYFKGISGDWVTQTTVPHYSTDIVAAIEIFSALRKRGWVYLTIQSLPEAAVAPEWDDDYMVVAWWAEFSRYRSPVEVHSDDCETPALAVCLAALKAVDE
jgi:hypothetical protein